MKENKKISLKEGEAVPFVITKTTLERPPTIKRTSHYVGTFSGLKRLVWGLGIKVIDTLEEAFFEKDVQVDNGGVLDQKHYAVFVKTNHEGPYLDVEEIPWKPASGHHYEIVRVTQSNPKTPPNDPFERLTTSRSWEQTEETRIQLLKRLGIEDPEPKKDQTTDLEISKEETPSSLP